MADAHIAAQRFHMALLKDVAHKPVVLTQMDTLVVAGENASGILTAMLQNKQTLIQGLVHRAFGNNADDAAHAGRDLWGVKTGFYP